MHAALRRSHGLIPALTVVLILSAGCGSSDMNERLEDPALRLRNASRAIPGRYIVVLRRHDAVLASDERGQAVKARVDDLRRRHSFETDQIYAHALNGFAARMAAGTAAALSAEPGVAYVEQDAEIRLDVSQPGVDWGLDRLDVRAFALDGTFNYDSSGRGVHAYVIDSGIDATHPDFGTRVQPGLTWVSDGNGTSDCIGHGTHVAGTIGGTTYGVAKEVFLYPMRTIACSGSGFVSSSIAALDWIVGNGQRPAVVNMSLGGGGSSAEDSAVASAVDAGITVVVAAGNDSADACTQSPAREPSALTVGASESTGSSDVVASYSNWGPCVDVFAPGTSIQSDYLAGGTAVLSGTSMATPHVTGAVAQYLERNPRAMPVWIAEDLLAYATMNVVNGSLGGAPNRLLFTPSIPFARPGGDQTVRQGSTVTLDGSSSSSPQGAMTRYAWTQTAGPTVTLTGATSARATFTAPPATASTELAFRLRVTDSVGTPASNGVTVTVMPPPVANAGPAQTVNDGGTVILDGSSSTGAVTTWAWAQTAGPSVALAGATTSRPTFVAPTVAAPTTLTFRLTVGDALGSTSSASVDITVEHLNRPPVANAGTARTVSTGATVVLDGTASSDPDGSIASYAWAQTSGPTVTLTGATTAHPSFVPVVTTSTTLIFRLTVTDDTGATASGSVTITVVPIPVANAGPVQTVDEGTLVTLDGSGSSGIITTYVWTQTSGAAVSLAGGSTARPTFTAPSVLTTTTLTFQLTVTDAAAATSTATTTVSVLHVNRTPIAGAGPPQTVNDGTTVVLDGSASSDPDGLITSYSWSQTAGPSVALTGASTAHATFVAPAVSALTPLTFQLRVTDDSGASASASVIISVVHANRVPVVSAGESRNAAVGDLVTLDGSQSSDPDGFIASYAWTQIAGPSVTLTGAGTPRASFTVPTVTAPTALGFRLMVTDDVGMSSSASVTITVIPPHVNQPPTAVAGVSRTVPSGTVVVLDGTGSVDPDGSVSAYAWAQTAGPTVALASVGTATTSFVAPTVATTTALTFRLIVTDDAAATSSADVVITVSPGSAGPSTTNGAVARASSGGCASAGATGIEIGWLALLGLRRRVRN